MEDGYQIAQSHLMKQEYCYDVCLIMMLAAAPNTVTDAVVVDVDGNVVSFFTHFIYMPRNNGNLIEYEI